MVLAGPYLGEHVAWQTLVTVLVGMAGVLIMLRPGAGLFDWAALLSLASALLYGFSQLMARKMGDSESASVMTFYQNGVYLVGAAAAAALFHLAGVTHAVHPSLEFLVRPWTWPTLPDFAMMTACCFIASIGMILLSQAYRLAPANRVATFEYTGILWSPLWGFVFFAEVPRHATVIGATLIVGAGLFALGVGRHRNGAVAAATPPPGPA
jgi:drug/metabolite transporter (DMT)-like permease